MIGKVASKVVQAGVSAVRNQIRDQVADGVRAIKEAPDLDAMREKIGELTGITFFGKMLQTAEDSPLKSDVFKGGRGEEVFRSQLNMELAREAGRTGRLGLGDAIAQRLMDGYAGRQGQQDA